MKKLDKELEDTACYNQRAWGKLLSTLMHQLHEYMVQKMSAKGYPDFKMLYMRFIMNIDTTYGTNTNELSQYAFITKQGMSKILKELEALGFIYYEIEAKDKRSRLIKLTDEGKHLVLDVRHEMIHLKEYYAKTIGKQNMELFLDQAAAIIELNKKLMKG